MALHLIDDLKRFEGFRGKVYRCPGGRLTVGFGRNLEDNGVCVREAELLLLFDVAKVIEQLDTSMSYWRDFSAVVQCVLVQMGFQLGVGGLLGFRKFLGALRAGDLVQARAEMLNSLWARQTPRRAEYLSNLLVHNSSESDTLVWEDSIDELLFIVHRLKRMTLVK